MTAMIAIIAYGSVGVCVLVAIAVVTGKRTGGDLIAACLWPWFLITIMVAALMQAALGKGSGAP